MNECPTLVACRLLLKVRRWEDGFVRAKDQGQSRDEYVRQAGSRPPFCGDGLVKCVCAPCSCVECVARAAR